MSPSPSGLDAYGNERGRYSNYQQGNDGEYSPGRQYRPNSFYGGGLDGGQEQYRDERPASHYQNNNRMGGSPLAQPSPSRPNSNFLPSLPSAAPLGIRDASDEELEVAVRRILDQSDLNTVTKKGVRKTLEAEFGCDLSGRKETINAFIEAALTGA